MIENYQIQAEKYEWDIESTFLIPVNFHFKTKLVTPPIFHHLWLDTSDECVNMKWYGTYALSLTLGTVNAADKPPVYIANNVVLFNTYHATHTHQHVYDAFTSYFAPNLLTAEIYGNPNTQVTGVLPGVEVFPLPAAELHDGTNKKNVNFFSEFTPELLETLDLMPYLLDVSEIEYNFENIDDQGTLNNLYFETSDLNLSLSAIANGGYIKNFFGLFDDTSYNKFLLKVLDLNGGLIYRGIINQSAMKMPVDNISASSDVLKVQALGFEKEFKQYYLNEDLEDNVCRTVFPYVQHQSGTFPVTWKYANLMAALEENFSSGQITWNVEAGIQQYSIMNFPMLKRAVNLPQMNDMGLFLKSGYEIIRAAGKSKFDWLEKMCLAMGWKYYFYKGELHIENRTTESTAETVLDFQKVKDYEISKAEAYDTFDNIMIRDGLIYGADDSGFGSDFRRAFVVLMSTDITVPNTLKGWTVAHFLSNGSGTLIKPSGYKWYGIFTEDDEQIEFIEFTWTATGHGAVKKRIGKRDILFIADSDLGETANWTCDLANGINHLRSTTDDSGTDIWFRGNFGWSLFKITDGVLQNYEDYRKSGQLELNYAKFRNVYGDFKLSVKYSGVLDNPLVRYRISNGGEFNGLYGVSKLKISMQDDSTNLELQRISE